MSERRASPATVQRWSLPDVAGPVVARSRDSRAPGAAADQARSALQEAEARGYEAGLARAQAETQANTAALSARVSQLDAILQLLASPLQQLDASIERELVQLTLAVGKQLARRELRIDPGQVIQIIRECLGQLPAAARDIRIHLHPEDAATIRELLPVPANERAWLIVEEPTLTRGGCLVRTDTSQIDARLESRINAVIAHLLGDERAPERPAAAPET